MDNYFLPTAQPKPVDVPMSYKRGPDSVSHSQADSTASYPLIMRNSNGLFGHPSMSLALPFPPTFEPFEETMSYDEDIAALRCNERSQWDDMDCRIAPPISSARSFIDRTPLRPNDPELSWSGTHAQHYNIYGQEPPHSPPNSYNEHVPLPYLQSHMSHRTRSTRTIPFSSSTASTFSSTTTSFMQYQTLLPPISTVSPYASSDSSSSSSSPLSTPEITIRTPITVHQPRPSRRIPIVSLSELASACDDFTSSPVSKDVSYQKPFRELLSPLTTNIPANYTSPYSPVHSFSFSEEMGMEGAPFPVPFALEEKSAHTAPIHIFNDSEEVVICTCGCMASYIMPQSS